MMAVDILPASIPLDASRSFSDALMPYLTAAIDFEHAWQEEGILRRPYPKSLERATIAKYGKLTEKHAWLLPAVQEHLDKVAAAEEEKPDTQSEILPSPTKRKIRGEKHKILILGSGMVAQPAVDMLARRSDVELVIGV